MRAAWIALIWLAACAPAPQAPGELEPVELSDIAEAAPTLSAEGYGPIRIGMSREDAAAAFGQTLLLNGAADPACEGYVFEPGVGPEGMRFLALDGAIARISDHGSQNLLTDAGIAVGAGIDAVRTAYAGAEESGVEDGPGRVLTAWRESGALGLRFWFDGEGRVTEMAAGTREALLLTEGCS